MTLAPGLSHSRSVTVTEDMTPAHLRGDAVRVLATPEMVRLIEQTAIECVQAELGPGQTTVGTVVNVRHLAATPEGMTVTVAVELTEVDRRRLAFRVEVRDEVEKVGEGAHERFVIDRERFVRKVDAKKAAAVRG